MRFLKTLAAVLFGVLIGVGVSHPFHAKAASTLYVGRLIGGANAVPGMNGRQVVGFSCVPSNRGEADCYVAAQ
jgi:hypothetical protein